MKTSFLETTNRQSPEKDSSGFPAAKRIVVFIVIHYQPDTSGAWREFK